MAAAAVIDDRTIASKCIKHLKEVVVMKSWPLDAIRDSDRRKNFLITQYRPGEVICKDSNQTLWLYFIISGHCRVLKRIQLKSRQKGQTHADPCNHKPDDHKTLIERKLAALEEEIAQRRQRETLLRTEEGATGDVTSSTSFLEIQKLGQHQHFGLVTILFQSLDQSTSVSLVSDGAEVILLNKHFFLGQLEEGNIRQLRSEIRPYPSEEELQQRLEELLRWTEYKKQILYLTLSDLYKSRQHCQ